MSLEIDLQINNESRFPLDEERLFGVVESTLSPAGSDPAGRKIGSKVVVSLLIVDEKEMAEFNLRYHDTEGPTDVLSFPYTDPQSQTSEVEFVTPPDVGIILGDLIVCFPVAEKEAANQGKSPQEMVEFYVEHGLQHLLGHHHD